VNINWTPRHLKWWARPGFEPRTLSENQTPRPTSHCYTWWNILWCLLLFDRLSLSSSKYFLFTCRHKNKFSHLQGICIWACLSFSERILPGRATWHRRKCIRRGSPSSVRPASTSTPSRPGCERQSCESFAENSLSLSGSEFLKIETKKCKLSI